MQSTKWAIETGEAGNQVKLQVPAANKAGYAALLERRPTARDENLRAHALGEFDRFANCVGPARDGPGPVAKLLASRKRGERPEVVNRVERADLREPGAGGLLS